ncbi:MAG: cytochrome c3 family protein [Acidobacteriota bacterium]|nr:cytochrome c3 family protein [Acidobacteriota bacterium]MDH3522334.1 cytochrome c3 family protein [Acidobacteriota bacterium]
MPTLRLTIRVAGLAALAALALLPLPAGAVEDEDCLACHADLEDAAGERIAADLDQLSESMHGEMGLACVDCHADVADFDGEHPEKLAPAACGDCHDDVLGAVSESAHMGQSCGDCHGGHEIRAAADEAAPTSLFRTPALCASCHEALGEQASQYLDGIHGRALVKSGLKFAPSCVTCHGAHEILPAGDPRGRVYRTKVAAMCGSCHEGLISTYSGSVHAQLDAATGEARAVCSDCHPTHAVGSRNLPAWRQAVVAECGECHGAMLESFSDGFHGQATLLGFARVAKCSDCHGSHDVLAVDDPASRVAAANVVATCSGCHEGATANWADYDPHADLSSPARNPQAYWAQGAMKVLLASVFGFFFLHTALWLPRSLVAIRRGRDAGAAPPARELDA